MAAKVPLCAGGEDFALHKAQGGAALCLAFRRRITAATVPPRWRNQPRPSHRGPRAFSEEEVLCGELREQRRPQGWHAGASQEALERGENPKRA
jgi:hypothetical protein